MSDDRSIIYPVRDSFSRQQVHERTGVADDVLAFWIKQGLLVPMPAARRAHRRFSYEQLHIAAVLDAMRSLGSNISILRAFASAFQSGFEVWLTSGLSEHQLRLCTSLAHDLHIFESGETVRVQFDNDDYHRSKTAESKEDIIQSWLWREAREGATRALAKVAAKMNHEQARNADWACWLTEPTFLSEPDWRASWVAWVDLQKRPKIVVRWQGESGFDDGPVAGFFITISALIQRLWPEQLRQIKQRKLFDRRHAVIEEFMSLYETDPVEAEHLRLRLGLPKNLADFHTYLSAGDDMTG